MAIDLSVLDADQRVAAEAPRGPVCILAGAGTGKTRTITYRIANLIDRGQVAPNRVLAVTFTKRAAGEMRARLRSLGIGGGDGQPGVQAVTFHAAAMRQLRYFWPRAIGDTRWELLDNKFPVIGRAARDCDLRPETDTIRDLLSEIDWAKASLVTPETYAKAVEDAGRTAPMAPGTVADVYAAYERRKTDQDGNRLLDFDDLILLPTLLLQRNEEVRERWQNKIRYLLVDEYQDTNTSQYELVKLLVGQRARFTVVGDDDQSIYGWRGAEVDNILRFERDFPGAKIVKLERNYRSTRHILGAASGLIAANRDRLGKTLWTEDDGGDKVRVRGVWDGEAEARLIADEIETARTKPGSLRQLDLHDVLDERLDRPDPMDALLR